MPSPETEQPGLFDSKAENDRIGEVVLYALGEFQERGFALENRRLALDRLLGAFRRASDEFDIELPSDSELAEALRTAGATVEEVPAYVAKHPFRVTVRNRLAKESREFLEVRRKVQHADDDSDEQ